MTPLSVAEVRERYLRFFEARGHQRLPSDSLVPANDPTLLFTGAGMNQFKDMFLGKGGLPYQRVTTSQKCLRVPDLDNVGATPRHHTFFEMLGNFSFGDYFKEECIQWEWEFFSRELGIPERNMVVTVYEDDDEAFRIWNEVVGLEPERIFRFGEKENFWPAEAPSKGPNGPCGPCSEIYYDSAPDRPYPSHEGLEELPDDRFTEIGNCVFTQFDRQADGTLAPLPQKNIDVGLGLERITAVLAGAPNNFETDAFQPLLDAVAARSGRPYETDTADGVRMRRIADHARAVVFCVADGALPSNEGRGYVVRKILRRACRDGYDLGIEDPFLCELVDVVGQVMGEAYPEVRAHAGQCRSVIRGEEESFRTVYTQGMQRLAAALEGAGDGGLEHNGELAFQLHDTYGFPVDITRQVMADRGVALDEAEFEAAMEAQRARARAAMATADAVFADNAAMRLREAGVRPTRFIGYDALEADATLAAVIGTGHVLCDEIGEGEAIAVSDTTPFYAQGGGQVGDTGTIEQDHGRATVLGTTALDGYFLHHVRVEQGTLRAGAPCRLRVDAAARRATERNHTATHLLHAALKRVLGDHVNQAGSEVAPERLRFDYTHGERLTDAQIEELEAMVAGVVGEAIEVSAVVRPIAEARASGFVALFGEKYGDEVRTLAVGEFSKELCGGTHVRNSGNIGGFRIVSDSAISAGTRRIEAVTGDSARALSAADRSQVGAIAQLLKVAPAEVAERVRQVAAELKQVKKELAKALAPDPAALLAELEKECRAVDGVRCAIYVRAGLDGKQAQDLLKRAVKKLAPFAGVVLGTGAAQVAVVAAVSPDVADRLSAADLVAAATGAMGGGGGGRPQMAQGRGQNAAALDDAVAALRGCFEAAGLPV